MIATSYNGQYDKCMLCESEDCGRAITMPGIGAVSCMEKWSDQQDFCLTDIKKVKAKAVPVLAMKAYIHGEWRYSLTHFQPQHQLQMSGQHYVPTALPREKQTEQESGYAPQLVHVLEESRISSHGQFNILHLCIFKYILYYCNQNKYF